MRLVENFDSLPLLGNRSSLENFIDRSLLGDWIIRVEYSGNKPEDESAWLQWGSTLFALRSPAAVMEVIDSCYASHPEKEIRIHAEKVRPATRMVYTVNRNVESAINANASFDVELEAANQEWQVPALNIARAKTNVVWRYLAAVGALAGTLIVWEAASN